MRTFREIDDQILNLVNEDGEIMDAQAFEALQMERTAKIEGMARWALDLKDEQEDIKREIERLTALKRAAERKENSLREYIRVILGGEKFKTSTVAVSYRNTAAVEITDEKAVTAWAVEHFDSGVLKYKPEISKTAVKEAIAAGETIPGAEIMIHTSTVIK